MKKLLSILLMSTLACVASENPFHISNLIITTRNCTGGAGATTFTFSVAGGSAPYTLNAEGATPPASSSVDGEFGVITRILGAPNVQVTLKDTNTSLTKVYTLPDTSAFSSITLATGCPGILGYAIAVYPPATGVSVQLTGPSGFTPITKTDLVGSFENLAPGDYTIILTPTPVNAATPACNTPVSIPVTIAPLTFKIASVENTEFAEGSDKGELVVTVEGGTPQLNFTLTGPLPSEDESEVGPQDERTATFAGFEGGFYTLTVTDAEGCEVVQKVTINFFPNPVANRIALLYC